MADINFVLKELASIFGEPCGMSPMDEYMHERCNPWCDKVCGTVGADRCWKKYFETRHKDETELISER